MLFARKAVIGIAHLIITAQDLLNIDLGDQPFIDDRQVVWDLYFFVFAVDGKTDLIFCVL